MSHDDALIEPQSCDSMRRGSKSSSGRETQESSNSSHSLAPQGPPKIKHTRYSQSGFTATPWHPFRSAIPSFLKKGKKNNVKNLSTETHILHELLQSGNSGIYFRPDPEGYIRELTIIWYQLNICDSTNENENHYYQEHISSNSSSTLESVLNLKYKKLDFLTIYGCQHMTLPSEVGQLISLKSLVLENVPSMCEELKLLENLESLKLVNCGDIGESPPPNLKNLSIAMPSESKCFQGSCSSLDAGRGRDRITLNGSHLKGIKKLMHLQDLSLSGLPERIIFDFFSVPWDGSAMLRNIELDNCGILHSYCWILSGLPESLARLWIDGHEIDDIHDSENNSKEDEASYTEKEILQTVFQSDPGIECTNIEYTEKDDDVEKLELFWRRLGPCTHGGRGSPSSVEALQQIWELKKLLHLKIDGCPCLAFPSGIGTMSTLNTLILKNILYPPTDEILSLQNLTELELVDCGDVSCIGGNLVNLQRLSIKYRTRTSSGNMLLGIKNLDRLRSLRLSGFQNDQITVFFRDNPWKGIPLLEELEISNCGLSQGYDKMFEHIPGSVTKIVLDMNRIQDLGVFIGIGLPEKIRTLSLALNPVTKRVLGSPHGGFLCSLLDRYPQLSDFGCLLRYGPLVSRQGMQRELDYKLFMNRYGRVFLENDVVSPIPLSVWSLVLERASNQSREEKMLDDMRGCSRSFYSGTHLGEERMQSLLISRTSAVFELIRAYPVWSTTSL